MLRQISLIAAIGIAALVTGYLVVPKGEERATMLARDGLYDAASRELSALPSSGDRAPHILMQYHLLHERQGDRGRALEALEAYISVRPHDIAAREKRAEYLLHAGQLDRYLDALAGLAAEHPKSDRIAQLLGLYRLHGRFDDELSLLRARAGSGYLEYGSLERLGALLAERGDWAAAERWLRVAVQNAPSQESSSRLRLFDVLIEQGRTAEAIRQARIWITEWRSPYLSGKLLLKMAQAGLSNKAAVLARLCVDVMPNAAFEIAAVLTAKGHMSISQQMLAQWSDRDETPTGDQLRHYVYASVQAGDVQGPFRKLVRLAGRGAEPATQARLAEELAYAYGYAALAPLRTLLSTRVLLARPLFAAELAIFDGNPHLARWFITRVNPAELAPAERPVWLGLVLKLDSRRT